MENIRIGNSVHVSWRLYNNNGSQYALSGKIRRLWIISAALEKEITSYGIQGRNEIVFSVPADDLIRYGTYKIRLTIRESESETEDATYDLTQIFQVVSQSYPNASNAIGGVADLSFTSVLNNVVIERIEGLSAYEIAVNNGYEGTEQEWIAMYDNAVTAANNAAEEAIAATETVMANEESRQLAESARDSAEQARMVSEQSRVSAERARAQAEQVRQTAEQGRASSEQSRTIAETARETRAASDHATAQSDHTTAANDHSVAASDHTAAATDHTVASSDHSIAVADHEASALATEDANDAADAANDAAASVQHIVETRIGSETIHNIVELTHAEYDALQTKRDDTMYIITDTEIPSGEVGIAGFEQTTESTEDGGTNIWTVTLTNGQTFQLAVKNGKQGNTGSSVDYPYELVNNLTTDDATKGLSAAQGVVLEGKVSQLGQNKNYIPDVWTSSSGIVSGHSGYIVTDKIPGLQGEKVYLANLGNTTRYALAYDSQGNVIGFRSNAYPYYTLPEGTAFFVVCFGPNATDYHVYKNNVVVWKKTDGANSIVELKAITDSIEQEIQPISKKADDAYGTLYFWEKIPKLKDYDYQLTGSGKLGTTSSYKHYLLNVEEGDVIRLTSTYHTRDLCYAFLTTTSINHISGEVLPIVDGTKVTYYSCTGNNGEPILGDVEITIPSGCKALIFDHYSITYNNYYIRRNKTDEVVSCYNDYIKSRAFDIRKKDINLGQNADSLIFFTDYHIYNNEANIITNYGHSPALIKYLMEHTNTDKVVFGGDVFTSPNNDTDRYRLMDEFLTLFNFAPKMFASVGNHEWRQSSGNDGRVKDFGSLAKKLEGLVTFGRDSSGKITQPYYYFDNPALKVRYFVLYTPGPVPSSSYAVYNYPEQLAFLESKVGELTSDWKVIIIQHIMYETSTTPGAQESNDYYATKLSKAQCGTDLTSAIVANNANTSRAKIICVLSGHMHTDFCEFIAPSCVSICVCCDATYGKQGVAPNGLRICGTITEQSFDVYHFDLSDNVIYSTKIGFGSNRVVNLGEVGVNVGGTITLASSLASVDLWQSQDESVATIENGVVTGVSAGRVTIFARKEGDTNAEMEYFNIVVS